MRKMCEKEHTAETKNIFSDVAIFLNHENAIRQQIIHGMPAKSTEKIRDYHEVGVVLRNNFVIPPEDLVKWEQKRQNRIP